MYEENKIYYIKWRTLASGTHEVKARNVGSAMDKLEKDIKNSKVKVDYLDIDKIEIYYLDIDGIETDPKNIKVE